MHRVILVVLSALALVAMPGLALADAAGTAKGVTPAAGAARDGVERTLVVGSDVFLGDLIQTGRIGQVQILFADQTKLVVGPNSSLTIDDYLLRNDGSAGKFVVDMLAGSFRFATGKSPKDRYQINTPTGTIGIRGTAFDVFVGPDGESWIMLYSGHLRFCNIAGDCDEIDNLCDIGQYGTDEAQVIGDSRKLTGDMRAQIKAKFRYALNESPLLREFWLKRSYDCLHKAPDVPVVEDKPQPQPKPRNPD